MSRQIVIGEQNFLTLREENLFYIDKTKFIKDWWSYRDRVTLITRPRRFGKTLMLDTVRTFFSPEFADRTDIFAGLKIWEDQKFRDLQGTIPVIFLSLANIKGNTDYAQAIAQIKVHLANLYSHFYRILDFSKFTENEIERYAAIKDNMSDVQAKYTLFHLSMYLERQYHVTPIILLDEYDSPMLDAWHYKYWDELSDFMRGFFNSTFKTNSSLGRGLITGITRIATESIFSDLNNLNVVSITSDLYSDAFGFTEDEVFAAMDEYELADKEEVKRWYDGFIFGKQKNIYNPWSIIGYLRYKTIATYWGNTSSNTLVGDLIAHANVKIKEEFTLLMQDQAIVTKFDEEIVFKQLSWNQEAIWSLLLAAGYVKPLEFDSVKQKYKITLTNLEVKVIMERLVQGWFNPVEINKDDFNQALLTDDVFLMNKNLNENTKNIFSFFDISEKQPELFYHAFVLGLIVDLNGRFEITSNQESGYGSYDVMLIPKNLSDHAIIIEFKTIDNENENSLEISCNQALKQIKEKEYITKLVRRNMNLSNIYVYGFAFQGKKVLISGDAHDTINWNKILKPKKNGFTKFFS